MSALTEDQIQRYGRQILLREVGGAGQRQLLARPVEVNGWSEALEVAVTYLAAGGSPLVLGPHPGTGFLHGVTVAAVSPDAQTSAAPFISLCAPGQEASAPLKVVVGPGWLTIGEVNPPHDAPGYEPVALGALAALTVQRLVLNRDDGHPRAIRWDSGNFRVQQ